MLQIDGFYFPSHLWQVSTESRGEWRGPGACELGVSPKISAVGTE